MKTSELTGAALDWVVASAKGYSKLALTISGEIGEFRKMHDDGYHNYSTDWAQGGPIIEREKITLLPPDPEDENWCALLWGTRAKQYGKTSLIAAMRCYVASKLGDEVEIPKELTE